MANLQYIGARYVPAVYENPDDGSAAWKSGESYENLIIVTYNDDSYTSRKPVPASIGNPADNPAYWAKTGDFNAALATINHEISAMKATIPNVINIVELGADNTGNEDNSPILNTIFGNHSYDKATFYFPDGIYLINTTVLINNGANIILGKNAVIKANAVMTTMFLYNTISVVEHSYDVFNADYLYGNMLLAGGTFDGDGKADKCIWARRFCNFTIDSVHVVNFNAFGIDTETAYTTEAEQTAELKIVNCYVSNFNNTSADAVGIAVGTDNIIDNCIIVDGIIGLEVYGSNQVSNLHIWTSNDHHANAGSAIVVKHNQNNFNNIYTDCYFNGFDLRTGGLTNISNYTYYVIADHYVDFDRTIIHSSTNNGGYVYMNNISVDTPVAVTFTNITYKNKIFISNFHSNNTYGMPLSQSIPSIDKYYSYFWDSPLEEITDDLPAGLYGCKTQTNYKPDTGSRGLLFNIPLPDHNIRIYIDYNTGNIFTQMNKTLGSDWFNVGTNSNTASRINP